MNKQQFQELLEAGQLGEAIDKLQQIAQSSSNDRIRKKVIELKGRFNRSEKDKRTGVISIDDANKVRASIYNVALKYFDELTNADSMPSTEKVAGLAEESPFDEEVDSVEESPFDGAVMDDPDTDINFSGGDVTSN